MASEGGGGWPRPASHRVAWFSPRIASAAARARAMVSSLAIWRKSSTGALLLLLLLGLDAALVLVAVLLTEQGEVVDAGGTRGVVAGQGLGAGLGVGVPGDMVRGRG